jgi:hypothetical protein
LGEKTDSWVCCQFVCAQCREFPAIERDSIGERPERVTQMAQETRRSEDRERLGRCSLFRLMEPIGNFACKPTHQFFGFVSDRCRSLHGVRAWAASKFVRAMRLVERFPTRAHAANQNEMKPSTGIK